MDEAGVVAIHPEQDEPRLPSKSQQRRHAASNKAEPKRTEKVANEAAKTKFTVRLDPLVVKQIKVTAAEREITMERFVELAIKEKLEG